MPSISGAAVTVAIVAVAIVLALGFANLLRQGAGGASQRLMRWRVGLQFVAVIVVVIVLLARMHFTH